MIDDEAAIKRRIAELYDGVAQSFGQIGPPTFQHAGRRLVALAGVNPGARVLDVAAGRGAVLLPAGERVGAGGRALGIDLAPGMVRETSAETRRRDLRNVHLAIMDAEHLGLASSSFDFVLCSFAVHLFPRLGGALREFRRVLRPDGVLGIAAGGRMDPRWDWYRDLVRRHAAPEHASGVSQRSSWSLDEVTALLPSAGFSAVREAVEEVELAYEDEDEWWAALWTHGTRLPLESMTPEVLERSRGDARLHLRELATAGP